MEVYNMSNFMNFSSDKANIFLILLDESGSMEDDERNVKAGLRMYQKSFENFAEANSIAISICRFSDRLKLGEFKQVNNLDISYSTNGTTALNYSIVKSAQYLKEYIQDVTDTKKIVPGATFIVFSDGKPCDDLMSWSDGKRAIEQLNYAGITTVFVAFGEGIDSGYGKRMEFMSTVDVRDRDTLVNFLGVELSKSCKEQSMSAKSLGANFFSQAANNTKSEAYSKMAAQALEDTSWIDDI